MEKHHDKIQIKHHKIAVLAVNGGLALIVQAIHRAAQ